jgi:4-hydroxy-tetrahydrodipicolinate reductase
MRDLIRVLVLGTGQMGSGIARLVLRKRGLALAGGFARRPERASMDLGRVIGLERNIGLPIGTNLDTVIRQCRPQVAIQATCSRVADAADEILTLVRQGVPVISIAEEMAYPAHRSPEFATRIHREAVAHGVAVLGTGINPGFVLDLLVITLTGVCADIRSITATRVNDLSPYGPSVLRSQGVGLTPEKFFRGLEEGTVVGHYGFGESIRMIAAALGWEIERVEERREPIVSRVRRETPIIEIEPGQVAGCLHTAVAYREGEPVIELIHPQQVQPELEGVETGDSIEIRGTPNVRLAGSPEIPGGVATAALAVNMIPRLLNAAPGLHSMADLPPPAAMLGDVRTLVDRATPTRRSRNQSRAGRGTAFRETP